MEEETSISGQPEGRLFGQDLSEWISVLFKIYTALPVERPTSGPPSPQTSPVALPRRVKLSASPSGGKPVKMRAVLVFLVAAVATARLSKPDGPQTIRPITVEKLGGPGPVVAPPSDDAFPSSRVALGDLQTIQDRMKEQAASLKALQKQLNDGLKQKRRLELTQRLMTGVAQLHRAERALKNIDVKISASKASSKRLQDLKVEIDDSQRRAEAELARQSREQDARLQELKASSDKETAAIAKLTAKAGAVKSAVGKWKEYVAQVCGSATGGECRGPYFLRSLLPPQLRDLQQARQGGLPTSLTGDSVPLPPSSE